MRVMVTRPTPEGEALCLQLQAQGYDTIHLPVLEIKPLADTRLLREQIAGLDHYAWAIFISRSAVRSSAALIHEQWPQFPPQLHLAAVGEGTAEALRQAHLPAVLYPAEDWSSEGLLALPELQNVANQKIALFCGEGGRELLATTLQERGAEVTRFVSYQRVLPELDLSPCKALLRHDQIDAVVVTSGEGLSQLKKLFLESEWPRLKKIPLVLISERIIIQAKELGFESCFLAKMAGHEGILQALNSIRKKAMNSHENKNAETSPPVKNPDGNRDPKVSGSKAPLWFLMLLTLALLAAGAALFYRTDALNQNVIASLTSFSHETQWTKHQISDLQGELTLLQQRLQQQEETMRRQAQVLQEWRGLSQVGPSSRGRDHGAILDAHYFVRLAGDQLLLNKDLPQALLLLNQAQTELNRVADPQALPLKKAVAQDLTTLKNLPAINATHVYLSLSSLQQQIEKLPLLVVPVQNTEAAASASSPSSTFWERGLDRISSVLRRMVIVYHLPSAQTPPFITPDQRPYIYANLQATLGNAGWAVLHHDAEIYQANLQQATDWIRHYFSLNSPLTQTVLNELQTLRTVSVQPAKDVVLLSPKAFEEYLKAEPSAANSTVSS